MPPFRGVQQRLLQDLGWSGRHPIRATKYSPPASLIELALEPRDAEAVFRVTDHGVGITAEDRQRLFEPLRRFEATKNVAPGMGLGLYVVRRIVEAQGGYLRVDSAPGKGSTFRVHGLTLSREQHRCVTELGAGKLASDAGEKLDLPRPAPGRPVATRRCARGARSRARPARDCDGSADTVETPSPPSGGALDECRIECPPR